MLPNVEGLAQNRAENAKLANDMGRMSAETLTSISSGLSVGLHVVPSFTSTLSRHDDTKATEGWRAHSPHSSTQQALLIAVLGSSRHNPFLEARGRER